MIQSTGRCTSTSYANGRGSKGTQRFCSVAHSDSSRKWVKETRAILQSVGRAVLTHGRRSHVGDVVKYGCLVRAISLWQPPSWNFRYLFAIDDRVAARVTVAGVVAVADVKLIDTLRPFAGQCDEWHLLLAQAFWHSVVDLVAASSGRWSAWASTSAAWV
jgi:hypothetical protein